MNKESYLRQKGVNVDAGLNYTGDFETTFQDVLSASEAFLKDVKR